MPVRRSLRPLIPALLKAAPAPLAGLLVRRSPHWIDYLPPGKEIKFRRYLGDLTVVVDSLYPIEREMLTGVYDPPTVKVINRFVRPGAVCCDVGANVGALTLAMAKACGEGGRVYAVEPGPPTFERLRRNLALNPQLAGRVRACPTGLSDRPGSLKWSEDMNNRGNAGLLAAEGLSVPVTTLDEFCARERITRLDFLKADVEGMELAVFKGARRTLAALRPVLYFETLRAFADWHGYDIFGEIEGLLRGHGYALYKVGTQGETVETTSRDLSMNTLALPR